MCSLATLMILTSKNFVRPANFGCGTLGRRKYCYIYCFIITSGITMRIIAVIISTARGFPLTWPHFSSSSACVVAVAVWFSKTEITCQSFQ